MCITLQRVADEQLRVIPRTQEHKYRRMELGQEDEPIHQRRQSREGSLERVCVVRPPCSTNGVQCHAFGMTCLFVEVSSGGQDA